MIKSKYDERKYKILTLKNNLEIMLISDKDADKSAVSMNVGVGCFQDPDNIPGLAHFLEHMLFMGTHKYPDENDFADYLSKNGGISNAFTSPDTTNYHLEVNSDGFEGALDRFAHFFINPLFKKKSINKEMNAIHSEHSKNLQNDIRRILSLLRILSKKDHPTHKFCTGNLETLKEIPKKKNIDIYKEVLAFYKKWYSSNIMKLVILDKQPLNKMIKLVKIFEKIKNNNVTVQKNNINPYKDESIRVYSNPVNDTDKLEFYWSIDSSNEKYFNSSIYFVCEMLNYKGNNSFLTLLKKKGLIFDFNFGYMRHNNLSYYLVYLTLNLTKNGLNNIDKISELVYQFINYVNNLSETILKNKFRDLNNIAALNFMFKQKEDAFGYVIQISQNMNIYEKKYYLVGDIFMRKFKYPLIKNIFNNFLKQKTINIILSKDLFKNNKLIKKEYYYGTEYQINSQKKYTITISKEIKNNIKFPVKNNFIPTDFSIKPIKNKIKYPINIISNNLIEAWYKQDWKFKKPTNYMYVQLINSVTNSNPVNYVMSSLFSNIINDVLSEKLNNAFIIGYYVKLNSNLKGLTLLFSGYNNKFVNLIKNTLAEIIDQPIDEHRFNTKKNSLKKFYKNLDYQSPLSQARTHIQELLIGNIIYSVDKKKVIDKITYHNIVNFKSNLLSNLYLKFIIQGNLNKNDATHYINIFKKKINYNEISSFPKYNVIKLKNMRYIYEATSTNKNENDSCVLALYQFGKMNHTLYLSIEVLHSMINEPLFNQLRTKEQLGYIVLSRIAYIEKIICLIFEIQSSTKDPRYLQNRIDDFLKKFKEKIVQMTNSEFDSYVRSIIDIKKMKYINLEEEFDFNCSEVRIDEYEFNRKIIDINNLNKLKKNDIINLYDDIINPKRNLIVHVHGNKSKIKDIKPGKNTTYIKSLEEFKKNNQEYF